ncbi:MAG: CHAT domain-containing protein, partial [Acidimicrobiales bacterium]
MATRGLAGPALDARLLAARLALDLGRRETASAELRLAARARHRGPADLRARAWHAEALLRLSEGDRPGAGAALRAGMAVVDRFRSTLGATELRAGATGHGTQIAQLGVRLALEAERPDRALAWAERCRAATLLLKPARPPGRADAAGREADLRQVVRDLERAALAGRPTAAFLRRQGELEEAVRSTARHAASRWDAGIAIPASVPALGAALGPGRVLIEYVELDGGLYALVLPGGGRLRLRRLGGRAAVEAEMATLRFALRRLAHGLDVSGAAARSAAASAARLDDALLAPLSADLGPRDVVVVPTGSLASVPWCALASVAGRPVSVAPSATLWLKAVQPPRRTPSSVVLVAGPGLPAAAAEIAALARCYTGAVRLGGRRATAGAVSAALDGAGLAHVAAHGVFRADNPLFSCLHLADGPFTVYDLEGLRRAPATVVLSACDSAITDIGPGDELIGLASALFALGTRALVAAVVPVPDAATRGFMIRFHHHLRSGLSPATALAAARADARRRPSLA